MSGIGGTAGAERPLAPSSCFEGEKGAISRLAARRFFDCLGVEKPQAELARLLRHHVQAARPPVVGAMQITCSDEAERECTTAFQREFVRHLLPSFKFSDRAPFRSANLGARYEWGAARIAEEHFALAEGKPWKLLVVKINGHVSVEDTPAGPRFGHSKRFGEDSTYCGAIHATLDGAASPFAEELAELLRSEGLDRLGILRDAAAVDPALRTLFGAAVSARLQARRAMIDIQDHVPRTPTVYLIVPCVSLNRSGHDSELLCGVYHADRRGAIPSDEYWGLGDDPRALELHVGRAGLELRDPGLRAPRPARNHRAIIREAGEAHAKSAAVDPELGARLRALVTRHDPRHLPHAGLALKALLAILCDAAPVPAALLLFGEGAACAHHIAKAHRLARAAAGDEEALAMLRDLQGRLGDVEPERARHLATLLLDAFGG